MLKNQKKINKNSKEKLFSIIFFLSLIILFFAVLIIDHFTGFFTSSLSNKPLKIKGVECNVQTNVDNKTFVSMKFIIPYDNWKQRSDIKKSMPKIRNEILSEMSTNLSDELSQKDFDKIKEKLISIINKYVETPVKDIYMDKFNLIDHPRGNLILE